MTLQTSRRRLPALIAGGTALIIAASVFAWTRNRNEPRWTILRGGDAQAIVQFNYSEPEEVYDPDKASKIATWTPSAGNIAGAEQGWAREALAVSRIDSFKQLSITPDKLVHGYDRQYAGYYSHGRRLLMLSAHDSDLDRREHKETMWRTHPIMNWDEVPNRFWIDYDPATRAFGAPQPAWYMDIGKHVTPADPLPDPPDTVPRR